MEESYSQLAAVSQSMLKDLQKSPRLFEAKHILKTLCDESTRSQQLGTAIHAAILEPQKLEKLIAIPPVEVLASNGHRRGGKYDDWKAEQGRKIILSEDEADLIKRVQESARNHPALRQLLDAGEYLENPISWNDPICGVQCKGIPDLVCSKGFIVDIKTCQSVSDFDKTVAQYGYHLQAAFYITGCSIHYGQRFANFVIAAIETNPPYRIHTRLLDDAAIIVGHQKIDELLAEYQRRVEQNDWSEEAEKSLVFLSLPKWAF